MIPVPRNEKVLLLTEIRLRQPKNFQLMNRYRLSIAVGTVSSPLRREIGVASKYYSKISEMSNRTVDRSAAHLRSSAIPTGDQIPGGSADSEPSRQQIEVPPSVKKHRV
jgi:hypothetical protein